MNRLSKLAVAAFAVALGASSSAVAQDAYPSKPVRWIVPYAAGGLPDTIARVLAQKVSESLGQQILIENRGGAGGITGTEAVARAAPDGYTFLVADVGQVAINPYLYTKLPFDPDKDLTPVGLIATANLFLVANAGVPVKDFGELVALARAKPGVLNYGSSGVGSIHHLSMEVAEERARPFDRPYSVQGHRPVDPRARRRRRRARLRGAAVDRRAREGRPGEAARGEHRRPLAHRPRRADGRRARHTRLRFRTRDRAARAHRHAARDHRAHVPGGGESAPVAGGHAALRAARHHPVGSAPAEYAARIRAANEKYAQAVKVSGARIDN